jgi:hypothetical protein
VPLPSTTKAVSQYKHSINRSPARGSMLAPHWVQATATFDYPCLAPQLGQNLAPSGTG